MRIGLLLLALLPFTSTAELSANEPIDIGSRRELFVDSALIDQMNGQAELRLHHPTPREIAIQFDQPWEGNASGYPTVIQDGDLYRMYYRGHAYIIDDPPLKQAQSEVVCYAESSDGIHWTKPNLGLFDWPGSPENNIIWRGGPETHNFAPFIDTNPGLASLDGLDGLATARADIRIENNAGLMSLNGLHNITAVTGRLRIADNPALGSLSGLQQLASTGGSFECRGNASLASLTGLENLASVGEDFEIRGNPGLTNLSGLNNLSSVGKSLFITDNNGLSALTGLDNLSSVGVGLNIVDNPVLTSLSGPAILSSIEGSLTIDGNRSLPSLSGLENISAVGGALFVGNNDALATLNGLGGLLSVGSDLTIERNRVLGAAAPRAALAEWAMLPVMPLGQTGARSSPAGIAQGATPSATRA